MVTIQVFFVSYRVLLDRTQLSEELHSKSCIDEEEQHEEQTEIPHLVKHRDVDRLEGHFSS